MKTKFLSFTIALSFVSLFVFNNGYSQNIPQKTKFVPTPNVNMALGNPTNATSDTNDSMNYLMVKPQYSLSYNSVKRTPNWASWHVQKSDLGNAKRVNNFRPDNTLPKKWYHVKPSDYSKSGFDKGHQCPSADRNKDSLTNSATYLMTNMIPQAPKNNQVTWAHLEDYSRSLVKAGNEVYTICGVYGQGGRGSKDSVQTIGNGVVVPAKTWKILLVLPEGTNDLSRITKQTRVIAAIIPNSQYCISQEWDKYRVTVNEIEKLTGYKFFSNINADTSAALKAKIDTVKIPVVKTTKVFKKKK